ncbi:MAG: S8 family serine peptidase [Syntrophomonadaceae bacterium]
MLRKLLLIFAFFLLSGLSFAQAKYLIFFKDKGVGPSQSLSKTSSLYKKAESMLSERAVERRKKVMGEDSYITYEDLPVKDEYIRSLESQGIKINNVLKWFNAVSAFLSDDDLNKVLSLPFVEKLEKVKVLYQPVRDPKPETDIMPDGPLGLGKTNILLEPDYGNSFRQLNLSDVPQVHRKGISGQGVIIGILDSGFDWKEHEALMNKTVLGEHDFVFNDNVTANQQGDAIDQDEHGTAVFSIVGGYAPGKLIGPSFSAKFILAKTEDVRSEKHVEEDNYAAALEWMEGLGVDITSSSLGYNIFDAPEASYTYADMNGKTALVTRAAEMAFQRGVLTMTAAGNEGNNSWHYIIAPADGFNTIAVGAVSQFNVVAGFSSRGPTADGRIKPDIVAQGSSVYKAIAHTNSSYSYGSGTSFATPISSGCAGLLLSVYPYLTNIELRRILLLTSDNASTPDSSRGYGLVSALKAIEYPNIEKTNSGLVLHKAFLDSSGVKPESVKMFYSLNDSNYTALPVNNQNSTTFYTVNLPVTEVSKLSVYFTYTDSTGRNVRAPEKGAFNLNMDTLGSVTDGVPHEFVLSQNYPNPFNRSTKIDFSATANENAQLMIYNILGQKVYTFNIITRNGSNSVIWNGINENGSPCASGIYLYGLKLGGSFYTKKMILLK